MIFRSPSRFSRSIQALAAVLMVVRSGRFLLPRAVHAQKPATRPTPTARRASPARSPKPTPIAGRSPAAEAISASAPASSPRRTARSPSGSTPPTTSTATSASPASCAATTATPRSPNLNPYASLVGRPQISEYPFLAGPTYRFRLRQKTALSAFVLGGTAIGKFDGDSKGISAANLGLWPSTSARPAFSIGGSLDLNLYPNLAFRITPSYTRHHLRRNRPEQRRLRDGPGLPLRPPEEHRVFGRAESRPRAIE